jgi:peroxiredoxin
MAMTNTGSASPTTEPRLPDLELVTCDGRPVHLSDYRRDRSLVALFSGGAECGPCRHAIMSDLCSRPHEYARAGAAVLLILRCSAIEAELVRRREGLALPVLLDPQGEACRLVGAQTPDGQAATAVVVTDCSGRIYLESRPDQDTPLPTREAIFSCLRSIPRGDCAPEAR